jgi:FMN-dependent oxidoreductase (nitrilotriacetate monooxygenase family)
MIFADVLGIPEAFRGVRDSAVKFGLEGICHDPVPLIGMVAARAKQIGLAATLSTTFYPPFLLARLLTTLDHLTDGRIAWNVVTTSNQAAARNFGHKNLPQHDDRYDIADDYMDLCNQLWQSWEPDALSADYSDIVFADPAKVHAVDFESENFSCRGPLNAVASPQGRPVIVQAGSSDRGREFAARHAEVVICSKDSLDDMKAFHDDIKNRLLKYGRRESDCKILFTFSPIVMGASQDEVARKEALFQKFGSALVEAGLAKISVILGHDVSRYALDDPLPAFDEKDLQSGRSLIPKYYSYGRNPTLREIAIKEATKETFAVRGTYDQIAERLMRVIDQVGGDGFALRAHYLTKELSGYVADFVDHVVPILQRENYARTFYPEGTLRQRLVGREAGIV